ncbi:sterol O-acyltransferase 1 isoform X1 [Frieseomelitta varia]|uniref:sterol O-acyltransferase 1 isoform X1 n=1 Tax=Frieseomelitta varia TaxID=561572 RepID=UPI001CB696E3|nr:sterol O-acyltransferase 1 isoform X1 [Frieseomelitta varia]XP_043525856.1 sterol O-acyltransferase 1 isoform X1 [Frieseomelitta varia]
MEKQAAAMEIPAPIENFNETSESPKTQETESARIKKAEVRDIIVNEMQGQMQEIRQDILEIVSSRMNDMISEVMRKINSKELKDLLDSKNYSNRTKPTKENTLRSKQFLQRNSLLTDLYEIKHIRTLYNAIVAMLIILLIHTAVYDIRHTGSPNLGIKTIRAGFAKFPIVLLIWSLMKISVLGVYVAFCCWATRRLEYAPNSAFGKKIWDYAWLGGIILYQTLLFMLPTRAVLDNDLPLASSMIILMEQVRLVMKTHAFVRSVAPKFLLYKSHSETPVPQPPGFSKYLYFLFAPTLIYQDRYPRAKNIRWNIVLNNFIEVITIIFFVALLYERLLYPNYRDFGKQVELGTLTLNVLSSMLPGILMFLCGFYLLLHCWMNAFAELLRFADKMFYQDWWNSICYSAYYRTWNIVVHDWLYTYIYKDVYETLAPGNRVLSTCAVFAISAIMHEYILSFSIRFFYPVLLVLFGGIGLMVVFVLKSAGNIFLWLSLSSGSGILVSLYCMEYFARINCPSARDDFLDLLIPRTWTCFFK